MPAVVALACGPLTAPPSNGAPVNECPAHDCALYMQPPPAPLCNAGACLVPSATVTLLLEVDLSADSYFAPSRSFLVNTNQLLSGGTAMCPVGQCFHLPDYGAPHGSYLPTAQVAQYVDFNLGNGGNSTAIPVHATYRPLYKVGMGAPVEAATLGLPLPPVEAQSVFASNDATFFGPFGMPPIEFQAYLQPGLYERTITPDPPLDAAFPPDVDVVTVQPGHDQPIEMVPLGAFDTTKYMNPMGAIPLFAISRDAGLGGWTAYLRDSTTLRRLSPIATLSGTSSTVEMHTNHHPLPTADGLDGTTLVVAPPPGTPIPAELFSPTGKPAFFPMPSLAAVPAAATVTGSVVSPDGSTPAEADLVFEMTSAFAKDINDNVYKQYTNFEFTAVARARIDPRTGASAFTLTLPRGMYQLSVRPLGGGGAVTVVPGGFLVAVDGDPLTVPTLVLRQTIPVSGVAEVTDGRLLAGATVVAMPTGCVAEAGTTRSACLPRMRQTTTSANGTFGTCDANGNGCPLLLDPGVYDLQIRPLQGTRLPWVSQRGLSVDTTPVTLMTITIPAPLYAGLRLIDPNENPIVGAIVRVLTVPAQGMGGAGLTGALEVGEAITDENGQYDMYLDPTIQ